MSPMAYKLSISNAGASEEERAYRAECGDVLARTLPGIPHSEYRVLVMRQVAKLSPKPTTKDFAVAKAIVDFDLKRQGLGIVIPAARPGRRTV
jgi:hypothetical protein